MKTTNANLVAIKKLVKSELAAIASFNKSAVDRDAALSAMVNAIGYKPGVPATPLQVEGFNAIREAYIVQWLAVAKCERASAEKQWQRVLDRAGIAKPQSAAAIKKQAARDAAKPDAAKPDAAKPGEAATPAPKKGAQLPNAAKTSAKQGAAEVATATVATLLSAVEVEIIRLIRAGEFALVHAKIKSMEPAML